MRADRIDFEAYIREIAREKARNVVAEARLPAPAESKYLTVKEVGEIVAFILADAKQPLCTARRRGGDL